MSSEDQIGWVTLEINLSESQAAGLEKLAQAQGLSLTCYCVHVIHDHLMKDATAEQKEQWQRTFPATLRRNGCNGGAGKAETTT